MSFFYRFFLSFCVTVSLAHASCFDDGEKVVTRVRLSLPTKVEFGAEVPLLTFDSPFVQLMKRELVTTASFSLVVYINNKPVYAHSER